jgi:hypothetical protein
MKTLIRAAALAALGSAAFWAIFSLDKSRARRVANAKAVTTWEGEGGNLAPTVSAPENVQDVRQ